MGKSTGPRGWKIVVTIFFVSWLGETYMAFVFIAGAFLFLVKDMLEYKLVAYRKEDTQRTNIKLLLFPFPCRRNLNLWELPATLDAEDFVLENRTYTNPQCRAFVLLCYIKKNSRRDVHTPLLLFILASNTWLSISFTYLQRVYAPLETIVGLIVSFTSLRNSTSWRIYGFCLLSKSTGWLI